MFAVQFHFSSPGRYSCCSTFTRSFETSPLPCHNPLQTVFFLKPPKFREDTCCFCKSWNAGFPSCLGEKPVGKLWTRINQVETSEHLLCLPLTKTMPPLGTFFQPSNHFLHLQICSLMVHRLALVEWEGVWKKRGGRFGGGAGRGEALQTDVQPPELPRVTHVSPH